MNSFMAQDITGKAILFEIGAKTGILDFIETNEKVNVSDLSRELGVEYNFLKSYLDILESLELVSKVNSPKLNKTFYFKTPTYQLEKNKAGYLSWGMMSCAPLISNTKAFTSNFYTAVQTYHRCGEHVARTSKWMGEKDFYPQAEETIIKLNPKKVVDLGSGICGLLIRLSKKLNGMKGIGVDISNKACEEAKLHLKKLNLSSRIEVVHSPIQNLIKNYQLFINADVVHAGFVFHDLLPQEEDTLDKLLLCINKHAPNVTLIIIDAIPFSQNEHERAFSGAFTFLHKFFMGREFLSETSWQSKLNQAGFNDVHIKPLGISGGRIFIAKKI